MSRNTPSELTAETRAQLGTAETVDMVDPQGNTCSVSVRHQKDHGQKAIRQKLDAGWSFPQPASYPEASAGGQEAGDYASADAQGSSPPATDTDEPV